MSRLNKSSLWTWKATVAFAAVRRPRLRTIRLELAGRTAKLFCPDAVEAVGRAARGIPRLIDRVAEHSLLTALREKKKEIDCDIVTEAVEEVEP